MCRSARFVFAARPSLELHEATLRFAPSSSSSPSSPSPSSSSSASPILDPHPPRTYFRDLAHSAVMASLGNQDVSFVGRGQGRQTQRRSLVITAPR